MDLREFAQDLKLRVDPVRVIGEMVALKKAGRRYKGLCPFHKEKTPSFSVDGETGLFYCFGCQEKGDIYTFLMKTQGLEFPEAVAALAHRGGVPVPEFRSGAGAVEGGPRRETLYRAMDVAAGFYHRQLLGEHPAAAVRAYLEKRGITLDEARALRLGFGGERADALVSAAQELGLSREELERAGLAAERGGRLADRFSGRLLFPITDVTGRVVAFGGRVIGDGLPKYVNSPETPIYRKGDLLYNLSVAREAIRERGYAIVVEGYLDALALVRHGFANVVATLGTALTENQVRLMARYTRKVVINFDPDFAGQNASRKGIELFVREGFKVSLLSLPAGEDPDVFLSSRGAPAYAAALKQSTPFMDFVLSRARDGVDMAAADGRVAFLQRVLPFLCLVDNKVERMQMVPRVAEASGIEDRLVLEELKRALAGRSVTLDDTARARISSARLKPVEATLLHLLLAGKVDAEVALRTVELSWLDGLVTRPLVEAALRVARKDGAVNARTLEAVLDDGQRELLAVVLATEEAPASWPDTVSALEYRHLTGRSRDLARQIRAAEQQGDTPRVLSLLGEQKRLQGSLAAHMGKGDEE